MYWLTRVDSDWQQDGWRLNDRLIVSAFQRAPADLNNASQIKPAAQETNSQGDTVV